MNRKLKCTFSFVLLLLIIFLISIDGWSATKKKKKVEDEVPLPRSSPWVLRHRYTFSWEDMGIDFDEMNGDWHIFYTTPDNYVENTVIEGYGPSFQLKSGEEFTAESFGNAITDRISVDSVFGPAIHFTATYPLKNELLVQQRATSFKQCSFVLFSTLITNKGANPVSIAKVRPIVFPPIAGLITRLPNENILRPIANIGGYWTYVSDEESQILEIVTDTKGQKIIFAVSPQGKARSKIIVSGEGDNWTGAVECEYSPTIMLKPGETIESDPVFISFSNDAYKLLTTSTWVLSNLSPPPSKVSIEKPIRGWLAVDPNKISLDSLLRVAKYSNNAGLNAILIPDGWEQPKGSLKGNSKSLSRDMKPVIDQLKNHGATKVGLTINPWAVPVGEEHSIPVSNEYAFSNFNIQEGLDIAKKRWEKLISWNPDFLVCNVETPDEVLEQLNTTRTEALHIGIKELASFFKNIPIYPMYSDRIINSEQELFQFCTFIGTMASFNSGIGPVKINNQILNTENFFTDTLLQSFPGPLIWTGEFKNPDIANKMAKFAKNTKTVFVPLDSEKREPSIWHLRSYSNHDSFSNSVVYISKDAQPLSPVILKSINPEILLWDFNSEKFIADNETIQNNSEQKFIGIVAKTEEPSIIGVKTAALCGMEFISSTKWDSGKKRMEILLKDSVNLPGTLYIYKPEALNLAKIVIDEKLLKSVKLAENVVSIPLKPKTEKIELFAN